MSVVSTKDEDFGDELSKESSYDDGQGFDSTDSGPDGTTTQTAPGVNSSSDGGGFLKGLLGNNASLNVKRSKCMVYLVLTTAAVGFGLAVYFLLGQQETENFESKVRQCDTTR